MNILWVNEMIKTININDLHIPYPDSLCNSKRIESDKYLLDMIECVHFLPPIETIDLGGIYSLTDGYHRVSIYIYLGLKKFRAEVY